MSVANAVTSIAACLPAPLPAAERPARDFHLTDIAMSTSLPLADWHPARYWTPDLFSSWCQAPADAIRVLVENLVHRPADSLRAANGWVPRRQADSALSGQAILGRAGTDACSPLA